MDVLIAYESMYGNTARIAQAIGTALRERCPVDVKAIDEIDQLSPDVDVLIVGGPTYAHGVEASMKAFLDRLPAGALEGVTAAAFDTRLDWPKFLSGAASKGIAERLQHKGARMITDPASFLVEDKNGPLLDGEEERAAAWGRHLATLVVPRFENVR
jgi:flavodoxin I